MPKGIHDLRYRAVVDELRRVRTDRGVSQEKLAEALGQRQQYVSKYESGERRLDLVEMIDVARALEIDPALLLVIASE